MINRVLCRLPEDTDDLLSGMNTWTDCHESDWFYLAIQEATNSHDFVTKDRVYESWTDLEPCSRLEPVRVRNSKINLTESPGRFFPPGLSVLR